MDIELQKTHTITTTTIAINKHTDPHFNFCKIANNLEW